MRFGVELAAAGPCGDPRRLAELARMGEDAGWDGVFLEDYLVHWDGGPTFDPWIGLAAMVLATDRLVVGTTVTPLPRRRPWKVARETVTLDHASDGRLILGVGLGGLDDTTNFDAFGESNDAVHRAELLDEGLDIVAGLWTGTPFTYTGRHFRVDHVTFLPPPVQQPRIPIWIGGSVDRAAGVVRRASRWDGVVPVPIGLPDGTSRYVTGPELTRLRPRLPATRADGAPFDIAIGGLARSADLGAERARADELAAAGATWWLEWIPSTDLPVMRQALRSGPIQRR